MMPAVRRSAPGRAGPVLRALLGAGALCLVLGLPNHPLALTSDLLLVVPLELPILLTLLAILPSGRRITTAVRAGIVAGLTLMTVQKLADFAMVSVYSRSFNPVFDLHLLPAAWTLGSGAVGALPAGGAVLALLAGLALLASTLWWATGGWAALASAPVLRGAGAAALLPLGAVAVADIGAEMRRWTLPFDIPGTAFTARVAVEGAGMIAGTPERLRAFRSAAGDDRYTGVSPLLDRIGDRDVLLTFLESYGASSLINPRYAPTHLETLARVESDLRARGLAMRSGWLEAPISGGQSWMSHATLAKGLWIPDQSTYDAALMSGRRSLFHLAQRNGFETVAVMPAITMEWPEAELMGFDRIHVAKDLGYGGRPFNWVTMPDQFTLTALERLELAGAPGRDRPPVFAQVALISFNAPWTPVPELVAWDDIGDGRIFDAVSQSGDPPEVVWQERERVRDQFRKAIDYSLGTVGAFAARQAGASRLLIVLGDHQPAQFVSGEEGLVVPIHVIGPERWSGASPTGSARGA